MPKRSKSAQELFKRKKIARTLIGLKHRLAAEDEINEVLEPIEKAFKKKVLKGEIPGTVTVDVKELTGA